MAIVSDSSRRVNAHFTQFGTRFPEVFLVLYPDRSQGTMVLTSFPLGQEAPPFTRRLDFSIAHFSVPLGYGAQRSSLKIKDRRSL
jgi:hypothetical protein